MSKVGKNLISNYAYSVWSAVISVLFIPIYIKLLGAEAYGLIGFYITLSAVFAFLDRSLSFTLNRQLALYSRDLKKNKENIQNIVKSFEGIYIGFSILLMVGIYFLSSLISTYWLNDTSFGSQKITDIVLLIGLLLSCRWPISVYTSALNGLQKQVAYNVISAISIFLSAGGVVFVLYFIKAEIEYYFYWQIIVQILTLVVMRSYLWNQIRVKEFASKFSMSLLKEVWKFTAGMSVIALLGMTINQIDKVLLSKFLNLENFGYYMIAASVAASLSRLSGPVFRAFYPRMTQLIKDDSNIELTRFFHKAAQFMSCILLPATVILAVFSHDIIFIWSNNIELSNKISPIVSVLVIGNCLQALQSMPFAIQLAFGWTKLAIIQNSVSLLFVIPCIFLAANLYGPIGAAFVWLGINVTNLLFTQQFMFRYYLSGEKWNWYKNDILIQLLSIIVFVFLIKLLTFHIENYYLKFLIIVFAFVASSIIGIFISKEIKPLFQNKIKRFFQLIHS